MPVRRIVFTLLAALLLLGLCACGKQAVLYKVDYNGKKHLFRKAKDAYAAGTEVELYYDVIGTDTDYSFWLDGERMKTDYNEKKGYILRFTIPEHDVSLSVKSVSTMTVLLPETTEAPPSSASGRLYRVDYGGQKEFLTGAQDEYPSGSEVRFTFDLFATDTDYRFLVDGQPIYGTWTAEGYELSFIMPEHDVTFRIETKNSMEKR